MKTILKIVLWLLSIFFAYMIYKAISDPIKFERIKTERYTKVIDRLKDIRDAQEAYRAVTGRFANDFESLIKFVDTAEFTITQKRDSSYMEFNKVYQIDMLKEIVIVDTLGFRSVKDSIFKKSDRYKNMMNVPFAPNNEKFEMKAAILDQNSYKAPVFEAKVDKAVVLYDQPKELVAQEKEVVDVDEVNGPTIAVGSLSEVSTSGNWPTLYDTERDN